MTNCIKCGKEFIQNKPFHKFCSAQCRSLWNYWNVNKIKYNRMSRKEAMTKTRHEQMRNDILSNQNKKSQEMSS